MSDDYQQQDAAPEAAPQDAAPSLRDQIGAALEQSGFVGREEAPAETPAQREYRRDQAGKFANEQTAVVKPPAWYKPDYGVEWEKLPDPFRQALYERERAFSQEIQRRAESAKPWQSLQESLGEFSRELQNYGMQPTDYFAQLHNINQSLRQEPVATLQWLAGEYGVDWQSLVDAQYQRQATQDPEVSTLRQTVQQLEQQLRQFQSMTQQERQHQAVAQVDAFFKDRPHRDLVQQDMAMLLQNGRAQNLEEAYDMAVRLHPQLGPSMLAEQQRGQAQRARAAAVSSVRGAPSPGANGSAKPGDLRSTLEAAWEGLIS
jgi:hypothetical protein